MCFWRGSNLGSLDFESDAPPIEPPLYEAKNPVCSVHFTEQLVNINTSLYSVGVYTHNVQNGMALILDH